MAVWHFFHYSGLTVRLQIYCTGGHISIYWLPGWVLWPYCSKNSCVVVCWMAGKISEHVRNTGWPKKRPEICITITVRILHGAKFPLAHL